MKRILRSSQPSASVVTPRQLSTSESVVLAANTLTKTYSAPGGSVTILHDIELSIPRGGFVAITGPSGSGKSTLMTVLAGLDRPTSGSVVLDGTDLAVLSETDLARIRNTRIGFIFQSFHLVPSLTARENIMLPAEIAGHADAANRADTLLAAVGLTHRADSYPRTLSGGEKQRVAICRALVNRPAVIFADEPTGNLDSITGAAVLDLLLALRRDLGATLIVVTHDSALAARAETRIALRDGRVETVATTPASTSREPKRRVSSRQSVRGKR